jgi:hypothetical protein
MQSFLIFPWISLILTLVGIYFSLQAIWLLRVRESKRIFIVYGMIGLALLFLAYDLPVIVTTASMGELHSGSVTSSSSTVPSSKSGSLGNQFSTASTESSLGD